MPQGQIAGIKPYPNELKGLTGVFGEKGEDGLLIRFADWGDWKAIPRQRRALRAVSVILTELVKLNNFKEVAGLDDVSV